MGLQIKDILKHKTIKIDELSNKTVVIDSFNLIYQFLTTIRQPNGMLLTNSKGETTSHLIGLFSRTARLLEKGIKPVFVFDGKAPELKEKERERRKEIKLKAERKYEIAKEREDITEMKKYASRTARINDEIIKSSKELISAFGLPIVQAASEGEAQAAYMAKKDSSIYAVVSQDFDSLLYGAPRLIRNLSITGRRKKANSLAYGNVEIEEYGLAENLNLLGIDIEQLIALAVLIGTDYNRGGIKGIGPKKALGLVKRFGKDFEGLFEYAGWKQSFEFPWTEVFYTIKKMKVNEDYALVFNDIDKKKIKELLVEKYEFSEERVESTLKKIKEKDKEQKGLGDFF